MFKQLHLATKRVTAFATLAALATLHATVAACGTDVGADDTLQHSDDEATSLLASGGAIPAPASEESEGETDDDVSMQAAFDDTDQIVDPVLAVEAALTGDELALATTPLADHPLAQHRVGQRYRSSKIPYVDGARGRAGFRLTTWGKDFHTNFIIGHVGAQEYTSWSPDSRTITFTLNMAGFMGVYVLDVASGQATLLAKDAINRGSAFNLARPREVLYWRKGAGFAELTAVDTVTFTRRPIYRLNGATDASTPSQSQDAEGRYIGSWVSNKVAGIEYVQPIMIDTRPAGGGAPRLHHAFPWNPNFRVDATEYEKRTMYRDSASWNPVFKSKALLTRQFPFDGEVSSRHWDVYDFANGTVGPALGWPAHAAWSADGRYWINDGGLKDISGRCLNANGVCKVKKSGGVYTTGGHVFARRGAAEAAKGLGQRFIQHPFNGLLQEITLDVLRRVPCADWRRDRHYTIGYTFGKTYGGSQYVNSLTRAQYSSDGRSLLFKSNLRTQTYQRAPGRDDDSEATTDVFVLDVADR